MSQDPVVTAYAHLAPARFGDERYAFVADPHVQTTAGGRSIVRLQQHYGGIPLFGGEITLHIEGEKVVRTNGDVAEFETAGDAIPELSATDAVIAAVTHFAAKSDRSMCQARHRSLRTSSLPAPDVIASFSFPSRPTVFRLGRTASSPAVHLAWWRDAGETRLVWVVRTPFRAQSFLLLTTAQGEDKGRVVLCTRSSSSARCFANVFSVTALFPSVAFAVSHGPSFGAAGSVRSRAWCAARGASDRRRGFAAVPFS